MARCSAGGLPGFGGLLDLPGTIAWSDRRSEPAAFGRIGIVLFVDIVPTGSIAPDQLGAAPR